MTKKNDETIDFKLCEKNRIKNTRLKHVWTHKLNAHPIVQRKANTRNTEKLQNTSRILAQCPENARRMTGECPENDRGMAAATKFAAGTIADYLMHAPLLKFAVCPCELPVGWSVSLEMLCVYMEMLQRGRKSSPILMLMRPCGPRDAQQCKTSFLCAK